MRMTRIIQGLAALLLLVPVAAWSAGRQAFTEPATEAFDPATVIAARQQLNQRLVNARVEAGLRAPLEVHVTQEELAPVLGEKPLVRKIQVGVVKPVAGALDLRSIAGSGIAPGEATRLRFGAVRLDPDGYVWTGAIRADGATALRVHFRGMDLPPGAELFVYNFQGEAFGPYTRRGPFRSGEFWSHTVTGSLMAIQIHYRGQEPAGAMRATRLRVDGAGYLTSKFRLAFQRGGVATQGVSAQAFCSFNAECVVNAECASIPGAIQPAQDAVASILFESQGGLFICSGGLLADTDTGTTIPYFLTANHCISKNREASSVEAFFHFTTPCGGECYDPRGVVESTLGSVIRATGRGGDFTLLELADAPPSGTAFLGWNSNAIAFTDGADLFRVSHPQFAPQAYSEHSVDTDAPTCQSWPRGERIYSRDTLGATEGGSSGSPVLNSSGQVVGQLSGACGFDVGDVCNAEDNATVDGALAFYFDSVAPFLDPDDGGGGGGGGGGCDLGQKGDPCSTASECCSGKCTGKPGSETCK